MVGGGTLGLQLRSLLERAHFEPRPQHTLTPQSLGWPCEEVILVLSCQVTQAGLEFSTQLKMAFH